MIDMPTHLRRVIKKEKGWSSSRVICGRSPEFRNIQENPPWTTLLHGYVTCPDCLQILKEEELEKLLVGAVSDG